MYGISAASCEEIIVFKMMEGVTNLPYCLGGNVVVATKWLIGGSTNGVSL